MSDLLSTSQSIVKKQVLGLAYGDIDKVFAWGDLCDIHIIIHKPTGFINVTRLPEHARTYDLAEYASCKAKYDEERDKCIEKQNEKYTNEKRLLVGRPVALINKESYDYWRNLPETIILFEIRASYMRRSVSYLSFDRNTCDNPVVHGTYVEPTLAVAFLLWLSPCLSLHRATCIISDGAANKERAMHDTHDDADEDDNRTANDAAVNKCNKLAELEDKIQQMEARIKETINNTVNDIINQINASRDNTNALFADIKDEFQDARVSDIHMDMFVHELSDKVDELTDLVKRANLRRSC